MANIGYIMISLGLVVVALALILVGINAESTDINKLNADYLSQIEVAQADKHPELDLLRYKTVSGPLLYKLLGDIGFYNVIIYVEGGKRLGEVSKTQTGSSQDMVRASAKRDLIGKYNEDNFDVSMEDGKVVLKIVERGEDVALLDGIVESGEAYSKIEEGEHGVISELTGIDGLEYNNDINQLKVKHYKWVKLNVKGYDRVEVSAVWSNKIPEDSPYYNEYIKGKNTSCYLYEGQGSRDLETTALAAVETISHNLSMQDVFTRTYDVSGIKDNEEPYLYLTFAGIHELSITNSLTQPKYLVNALDIELKDVIFYKG